MHLNPCRWAGRACTYVLMYVCAHGVCLHALVHVCTWIKCMHVCAWGICVCAVCAYISMHVCNIGYNVYAYVHICTRDTHIHTFILLYTGCMCTHTFTLVYTCTLVCVHTGWMYARTLYWCAQAACVHGPAEPRTLCSLLSQAKPSFPFSCVHTPSY